MKATLIGFKHGISKKDSRAWLRVAIMYKDGQADGGAWVYDGYLDPSFTPACKAGEVYNAEFDPNGRLLDLELLTK